MAKKARKRGPKMNEDRRYPIKPDLGELRPESRFVTGTTSGGEQGIIIVSAPVMHAYWFDREGKYLRQESRDVSGWLMDKPLKKRIQDTFSSVQVWVKELGLTPGMIHVKEFHSNGMPNLWIRDYPMSWDDAEWGEGETLEDMLEWWHGLGAFVLIWNGFEYNINKEGTHFQ